MVSGEKIDGPALLTPNRYFDERGYFSELYNSKTFALSIGEDILWNQDNHSVSTAASTLRGLHFQAPPNAQAKLVRCGQGKIFDVALDIRFGSPTYGQWEGHVLSAKNGKQFYIPVGFAHGFLTLEPGSEIIYKCSSNYTPESEGAVRWDSCAIDWPLCGDPILSDKDLAAPTLADLRSPFTYGENS